MVAFLAVGGPRLDMAGGGWDAWPLVGAALALWIGRRAVRARWGAGLLVAALASALVLPFVVRSIGVVPTAALAFALAALLRIARAGGSARRNRTV
jgi:hypothetical protein